MEWLFIEPKANFTFLIELQIDSHARTEIVRREHYHRQREFNAPQYAVVCHITLIIF